MYNLVQINCKICGNDKTKFLGVRGNKEYLGAEDINESADHIVTNVVKCLKCGFIFTNPLIICKTGAYQDPNDYAASRNDGQEALFTFTLDMIEQYAKRGKILDIGCGKGEFLSLAKERGWEIFGLEPSKGFAEFISKNYGLNITSKPLEEAGYQDSFFDVVVLNMVLEHIDEPRKMLGLIGRILKKNGILFIEVPNMESLMLKTAALYFKLKGKNWSPFLSPLHPPFHSYGYNVSSLGYLLTKERFRIKKTLIRDSSLRGFRKDGGGSCFEKFWRAVITKFAGLIGQGDVLMVIAQKE